jgi:hypothetical protein
MRPAGLPKKSDLILGAQIVGVMALGMALVAALLL